MAEGAPDGGIEIRNLYKIFGPEPQAYIDRVRDGMTKTELNEEHHHAGGVDPGYHGAFGLRQVDVDPAH